MISKAEISEQHGADEERIGRTLDSLEAQGLIDRRWDPGRGLLPCSRRQPLEAVAANGPESAEKFVEDRRPETFRRSALEGGLSSFEVISGDGLRPDEPFTGVGTWLQFTKEVQHGR